MKRKTKTKVQQVLAKSAWYRAPSLAKLRLGHKSTARRMTYWQWEEIKANPANHGLCFPYRRVTIDVPQIDQEEIAA